MIGEEEADQRCNRNKDKANAPQNIGKANAPPHSTFRSRRLAVLFALNHSGAGIVVTSGEQCSQANQWSCGSIIMELWIDCNSTVVL